jgi:drug/metabolite transporter (DMT)-like permease
MAPLELNFWRWLVAFAALLPFTLGSLWRGRALIMRNGGFISLLALTGVVVPHTCVYAALGTTSAVNALLLMSVVPLLINVGDWAVFGEPMHKRQWLGMTLALTGAAILIARGDIDTLVNLRFGKGDLWMIPAVFSVAALVMMLPMMLISGSPIIPPSGARLVAGLLYVGVLASAAAFLLWNRGVARLGPGRSGPFLYLMPVYGSLLSAVFLGEAARNFQYAGGTLVFLGLWLARRGRG